MISQIEQSLKPAFFSIFDSMNFYKKQFYYEASKQRVGAFSTDVHPCTRNNSERPRVISSCSKKLHTVYCCSNSRSVFAVYSHYFAWRRNFDRAVWGKCLLVVSLQFYVVAVFIKIFMYTTSCRSYESSRTDIMVGCSFFLLQLYFVSVLLYSPCNRLASTISVYIAASCIRLCLRSVYIRWPRVPWHETILKEILLMQTHYFSLSKNKYFKHLTEQSPIRISYE